MNIVMNVKQQVELIAGLIVGSGTTALSVEQFITDSTPIIKYVGLCAGTLLSIILVVRALLPSKNKRKKK